MEAGAEQEESVPPQLEPIYDEQNIKEDYKMILALISKISHSLAFN